MKLLQKTILTKKFSMEILTEEFKPVPVENCEFRNWQKIINVFFAYSASRDSNLSNYIKDPSIYELSKLMKPSIQTLMEEIRSVVFEKN